MQSRDQQGKGGEVQKTPTVDNTKEVGKNQKVGVDESLKEIGKYRGIAQQNSMEAIKAAQDRYQKAKQTHGTTESPGT
ncbi:hypothetical protein L6452_15543 [Arctium lappa]|uniref:Uncharacterized protein n=1 Tax=Arctium lappa TaxID=4217 RepID=A0ACB9CNZ9_ARCLA|nr:hypothetical protein L6452_15543 [Arctium lappa]